MDTSQQDHKLTPKQRYALRRKSGLRGQGDRQKGASYPKGMKIPYTDRKGVKKDYANALGSYMVGMRPANRRQYREQEY